MNPQQFIKDWTTFDNNLRPISLSTLTAFNLDNETIGFLNQAGLPKDAAPFLSFVADKTKKQKYDSISLLTDWFDFLDKEYEKFVVIGSDGSGDIIAINSEIDIIQWLDHEDYFTPRFMNSSISQLVNSLLAYKKFIVAILSENGENAIIDSIFTDSQFETLKEILKYIDTRTISEGFWHEQLEMLLANRAAS